MIEPTEKDIGRRVLWFGNPDDFKQGVLVNFDSVFAWVRYDGESEDRQCRRRQLGFIDAIRTQGHEDTTRGAGKDRKRKR